MYCIICDMYYSMRYYRMCVVIRVVLCVALYCAVVYDASCVSLYVWCSVGYMTYCSMCRVMCYVMCCIMCCMVCCMECCMCCSCMCYIVSCMTCCIMYCVMSCSMYVYYSFECMVLSYVVCDAL